MRERNKRQKKGERVHELKLQKVEKRESEKERNGEVEKRKREILMGEDKWRGERKRQKKRNREVWKRKKQGNNEREAI